MEREEEEEGRRKGKKDGNERVEIKEGQGSGWDTSS